MKRKKIFYPVISIALLSIIIVVSLMFFTFRVDPNKNLAIKLLSDSEFLVLNKEVERYYSGSSEKVNKMSIDSEKMYKYQILFDIDGEPRFVLFENESGGYFIMVRETETIYERSESGHSPYFGLKGKLYYNGFGNYYVGKGDKVIEISSNYDITDYLEFCPNIIDMAVEEQKATVEEVVISNNAKVVKASDPIVDGESRWETESLNHYTSTTARNYFEDLIVRNSKDFYVANANDLSGIKYDVKLPRNNDNGCGVVALVMAMQYYERNGIVRTVADAFTNGHTFSTFGLPTMPNKDGYYMTVYSEDAFGSVDKAPLYIAKGGDISYAVSDLLEYFIDDGYRGGAQTAITSDGIKNMYKKYCDDYRGGSQALYLDVNMTYNNMVDSINSGNIAIGQTSTGNGYYYNNGWRKTGAASHQMVAYGYCVNTSGTLKDFICHSGWRDTIGSQKMYVYKTNFIRNLTISVN